MTLRTDNYYPGARHGAAYSYTIHSTRPPTLRLIQEDQNPIFLSLNDILSTLTFTYIAHEAPLYWINVNPSTLLDGFVSITPIRNGCLDEQSRLLQEHL